VIRGKRMVKCTKKQIRKLKTALHWKKIPTAQRERIQMVLLRESGMTQLSRSTVLGGLSVTLWEGPGGRQRKLTSRLYGLQQAENWIFEGLGNLPR
jgi:hypothetical protein